MLSKTHWHFKPLVKSLLYFSSVGVGLSYLGVCLKDFSIGTFFLIPGTVCLLLSAAAGISLMGKTSNDYYGVFSLKQQKAFRVVGLLSPWIFLASSLAGYYSISQVHQQMLTNRAFHLSLNQGIKLPWSEGFELPWCQSQFKNAYGFSEKDFSDFAKTVTVHFAKWDSKHYKNYMKTLMTTELSPGVVRKLKSQGYLPANKLDFEKSLKNMKKARYDKSNVAVSKPQFFGKSKPDNFLKYKTFIFIPHIKKTKKLIYHIGISTKYRKPMVAHMEVSDASRYDNPQW